MENRIFRKTDLIIILVIAPIFFIIMHFYGNRNVCKDVRTAIDNTEFSGVITDKFKDPKNRYGPTLIVGNAKYLVLSMFLYDNAKVGDTIVKAANSVRYKLIKNNDTIIYYSECMGHIMDD